MRKIIVLAICAVSILAAGQAFCQVDFSETVTFGDSLTCNEPLWLKYGGEEEDYGPDPMESVFIKGANPGDNLQSYAVAGSMATHLRAQVLAYLAAKVARVQDRGTFFSIQIGGNDIAENIDLLASTPPRKKRAADVVINRIAMRIGDAHKLLKRTHPRAQFIIWMVPDVTLTPKYLGRFDETQLANIRAHIRRANLAILNLQDRRTVVFNHFLWMNQTVVNLPTVGGQVAIGPPMYGFSGCLFADHLHPSAMSNALQANAMIGQINAAFRDTIPLYTDAEIAQRAGLVSVGQSIP